MNFVKCCSSGVSISKIQIALSLFLTILISLCLIGCSDEVRLPSAKQLAEFERAGPILPTVDVDRLIRAKIGGAPLPGEVLEITMPTILQVVTAEEIDGTKSFAPYACRISESGTIMLPVVGEIEAAEKTLAEIESAIIDAYYPKYATTRPSVFVRLSEQVEQPLFTVIGLVNRPGNFPYPQDARYNVMQAVGFAGGLDKNTDPRYATVYRLKPDGTIVSATFGIVKTKEHSRLSDALSILIKPGDIVAIEHTPRTRTNHFLESMFNVNFGAYFPFWQ